MPPSPPNYRDEAGTSELLLAEPRELAAAEMEQLWVLFHAIGEYWKNTTDDSAGQRSSWTEFVILRATQRPSYVTEYENALKVIAELQAEFGDDAFHTLFQHKLKEKDKPQTRLDHAKKFVVDEFIRMQIVAGGFRGFGSDTDGKNRAKLRPLNYNGFVRGSRYNRLVQVRAYPPKASDS
jgi:hypothetical protein